MSIYEMKAEKEELKKYVELEGSEIGEFSNCLLYTACYPDYMSDEFAVALEQEIREQLQMFRDKTQIVKREVTKTYTITELVWNDDL